MLALVFSHSAQAATTGFNQTAAGPYDYNATANWVDSTINGLWDASLTLTAAQTATFAADTVLTTGLTFNHAGNFLLTLDSSSTTTRALTLGGDINVNTTGGTTANVTIGNSANHLTLNLGAATRTLTVAASRTLTLLDVVSNGGITKAGSGTLTLSGTNAYASGTTVSAGTLKVGSATALGANTSAVSVTSGAALDLNGATMTNTNALTLNGTGISSGGALINSSGTAATYAGLLTLGSDSSILAGGGDITLSNAGSHTGSGLGLTIGGAKNTTLTGILGTATGTLTKQDAGTLTLNGANTYTGATAVNAGTLNLTGSLGNTATTVASGAFLAGEGSIGASGSLTMNGGSTLRVNGSTPGALTVNGNLTITTSTNVVIDSIPATVGMGSSIRLFNYAGTLTGSTSDLVLANAAYYRNPVFSTVAGSPNQINLAIDTKSLTWSGATGVWDNNLTANWDSGADNFAQGDAVTFNDSGTTKAVAITGTVVPSSVTFNNTTGNDYTVAGIIGGLTGLSANGTGKVTLAGTNSYTGTTTVSAGTLILTNTNATGTVSIAAGAVLEIQKEQALNSTGSVTLSGSGTLRITGALVTTTGAGAQLINLGSGALIDIQVGSYNGGYGTNKNYTNNKADLNLALGTTFGTSNGTVRVDALTGLGTVNASSGSFTGGSFTFGVDNGTGDFGGLLATSGGNKFPFTKLGTGTQTLSGINTYTSTMNVNGGVLLLSGAGTLGVSSPVAMGGGQLDLGGSSQTVTTVTATAAYGSGDTIRNGSLTGTSYAASNTSGTVTISANLLANSTAGFAKTGAGAAVLAGTNTYTGTTSVGNGGGSLQINSTAALPAGSQISLTKSGLSTGTLKLNTSGTNSYGNTFGVFSSSYTSALGGTANIENVQGDNTVSGNMTITGSGGSGVNLQSDTGMLRFSGTLTNTASGYRAFDFSGAGNGVFSGLANDTNGTTGVYLSKNGAGSWSFTGTSSNFIGGVSVLQGVLNVASVANTGTNSSIGAGGAINLTGQATSGTLQYTGSTAVTTNHALTVAATGGTLDASGTGSGTLKFTGTVTSADPGTFNLNFTTGSNVATNTVSTTPGTVAGNVMSATIASGLLAGTTITSISGNSYTLSNPFTGTTGAVATTFGASVARTLTLTGSNTGDNGISGNLANSTGGGVLSVSKTGNGTWVLSGAANTYTGATTVTAGTLALVGGSQASPISVASGATLGFTLGSPASTTTTVTFSGVTAKVAVSGTPVAATLMTASNIIGAPVLDPAIPGYVLAVEAGGTQLNLKAAAANNYNTWATTNGVPGQAANLDHDNDGVSNGVEYFLGGPTGNTTGFTALPGIITVGSTRSVTWVKAASYTGVYGTDFVVETTTTLAAGSWTPEASPGNVTVIGNNVTYTFPAGPVKQFARLNVTGP